MWNFLQKQIAVGTLHLTAGDFSGLYDRKEFYHIETAHKYPNSSEALLFFQIVFSRRYTNKYIKSATARFLAELFQPASQIEIQDFCVFKLDVGLYE